MVTQRQYDILAFIHEYTSVCGYAPTVREIGRGTRTKSTSAVAYNLERLEDAGLLFKSANKSRTYVLTGGALELLDATPVNDEAIKLRKEIQLLMADNERLRHEFKVRLGALQREVLRLTQENEKLRQTSDLS